MSEKEVKQYPRPDLIRNVSDTATFTDANKLIFVMVGLPARGKTFIARKIRRYLRWLGFETEVFNVGNYRRRLKGADQPAEFFNPDNAEGVAARRECARAAVLDMVKFLRDGGKVAIYDATNSTKSRRKFVQEVIKDESSGLSYNIVWIETICTNENLIEKSIREFKLRSPDYKDVPVQDAYDDFSRRISFYQNAYEPLDDDTMSYVKLIDENTQIVSNRIEGFLQGKVVFFLMNLKVHKKPIFITRHGESQYNVSGRIGGDSPLSEAGRKYALSLAEFMRKQPEYTQNMSIWCSTLRRTVETVTCSGLVHDSQKPVQWRALCEIESGTCDGLTYKEIEDRYPREFAMRKADKFNYRYPRGESYHDIILRLEPVIFELERSNTPVLVVGHRAVLRCLYAYFRDVPMDKVPHLSMPLHTVTRLSQTAYSCDEKQFKFAVGCTDEIEHPNLIKHSQLDAKDVKQC